MDKEAVLTIISDFRKELQSIGIEPQKIVLFGSYARQTASEGSDIDLVVISDDFKDKGYWQRLEILAQAIYSVFKPIEAVAMTPQEWQSGNSMITDYARDGLII